MSEQVKKWIVIHNKYLPFVDDIVSEKNFFSGVERSLDGAVCKPNNGVAVS